MSYQTPASNFNLRQDMHFRPKNEQPRKENLAIGVDMQLLKRSTPTDVKTIWQYV